MGRIITSYSRPKPRSASGFYFSPGNNGSAGELWTTDGTTVTKVWDAPSLVNIAHLAHATATGMLYIICDDYNASIGSDFDVNIYRLDPSDNSVVHFAGPYQYADEAVAQDKPGTHAAESGGYLYISNQGGHAPAWGAYVVRMNLSSGAIGLVAQQATQTQLDAGAGSFDTFFTGGLGIIGATMYWNDGVGVWNGAIGSLAFDSYLGYDDPTVPTDNDGFSATGSPVTYGGAVYYPGQYAGNESFVPPYAGYALNAAISRQVIDESGSTVVDLGTLSDTNPPDLGGSEYNRVACCTVLYDTDDVTPLGVWALDDGFGGFASPGPINTYVWTRSAGNAWSVDTDLQSLVAGCRGVTSAMKSMGGMLLAMVYVAAGDTYLVKRNLAGSWSILHTFGGYQPEFSTTLPLMPVARVSSTIKCHEM